MIGVQRKHLALGAFAALVVACGGTNSGNGTMSVHLVDGTTSRYTAINLEILAVSIHSAAGGWITLGTPNKVIDLLTLTGGVAETLADGASLPAGHYDQMRLVLGDDNTVVPAGESAQPLKVPSGQQSGVKLNVSFDVAPNTTKDVFIDFDAHRSVFVHQTGNSGKYLLRPVVRAYDSIVTGSILGTLTDASLATPLPFVTVTAQTVSSSGPTIVRTVKTDADGEYVLDLLPIGGTYHVVAQPVELPPVVASPVVYSANASGAVTLTAEDPTPTRDLSFVQTTSFGTLSGTITPPLGDDEADVVSLVQALDVGALVPEPLIVDVAPGSFDGTTESFDFTYLPFETYDAVVTRQGEDALGNPTFSSTAGVSVPFSTSPQTITLAAP